MPAVVGGLAYGAVGLFVGSVVLAVARELALAWIGSTSNGAHVA